MTETEDAPKPDAICELVLQDLAVTRGGRVLFSDLNLHLKAGEAISLTGANGAGKTSLLRVVAGLAQPSAGRLRYLGQRGQLDPREAQSLDIHFAGHQDGLKAQATVQSELSFWARWAGGSMAARDAAVQRYGLTPLLGLETRRLSAGQRRRVALARLAAAPRRLWLLDEPMAPLDAATRATFAEEMRAHLASGGLILAAVHDPLPIPTREVRLLRPVSIPQEAG